MYELNYLNFIERFILKMIMKKTVRKGEHCRKMKNFCFQLTLEARVEFKDDDMETFKKLMKNVYDPQITYL